MPLFRPIANVPDNKTRCRRSRLRTSSAVGEPSFSVVGLPHTSALRQSLLGEKSLQWPQAKPRVTK